jgi:hypothetical protein
MRGMDGKTSLVTPRTTSVSQPIQGPERFELPYRRENYGNRPGYNRSGGTKWANGSKNPLPIYMCYSLVIMVLGAWTPDVVGKIHLNLS